jgi:DNA-binding response OmpR family regulator
MSSHALPRPVDILYIGRADTFYDPVWRELQRDGYGVAFARTQILGIQLARRHEPRLIVINIASSQFSGENLCRTLGRRLPGSHRLVIAERGMGESLACEHRLVRPFTPRKFHQLLVRLLQDATSNVLQCGNVHLDLVARTVVGPNGPKHLTPRECDLLAELMRRPNQVISRKDLMLRVWNTDYVMDTRTLDVHIRWLREKVEPDPVHPTCLITRRGVGYMFVAQPAGAELPDDDASADSP